MAVVCNRDFPTRIKPILIISTYRLSLDNKVHVFICPAGARWMLNGELALENKDIEPKDLRDERMLIKEGPPFQKDVEGASQT